MPLTRRGFIVGSAGAALAMSRAGLGWPLQTPLTAPPPRWLPTPDMLRHLPRLLELASVPGLALAVVNDGRVWGRGFGRAGEDPTRASSEDTVFEAASLGKPIFAYAVLRLADAGLIDLDRPLYDYHPIQDGNNSRMRRVTARHVLSHTTGLPNWRREAGLLEPATDPGKAFSYSGEGIFYLQRVIEALADKPFARLMREEVLDPLGMKQSSYVWLPEFESRMAAGYDGQGKRLDVQSAIGRKTHDIAQKWGKPLSEWRYEDAARAVALVNPKWPVLPVYMDPNAASTLLTTAADYAKYLIRLVARPPESGLDLREATRRAMSTPYVRLNSALHWGLGWGIQRDEQGEMLWHWGANNSFRNFVIADPANGRAIVVLTNSENGIRICERVIAAVTGHDHPAFLWI